MIERLKNRGPVLLSEDNPFLAGNLYLTKEMERSRDLAGFVNHRGQPFALAIEQSWLGEPTLTLFYPKDGVLFRVEDTGEDATYITGPFPIGLDERESIERLGAQVSKAAPTVSREPQAPSARNTEPAAGSGLNPEVSARLRAAEERLRGTPFSSSLRGATEATRSNSDQNALKKAERRALAETTPKGDVVHYVTFPGETLSMISRWYTADRTNAGRLARINNLANPNLLQVGDTIVIPSYLVKNRTRLQESDVAELLKESAAKKQMAY